MSQAVFVHVCLHSYVQGKGSLCLPAPVSGWFQAQLLSSPARCLQELPSYRVLKALSFEENKLTAEQVESAAAVALPALPTSNHLINQYHSHLQAPLSPLSNTQSQSSVAHNSSMTGLSRATDHYDGDPSSLLGNPASAQQHNDHPSAGHVFASGNQSVPVSHLSGLSATDGSQAATAQLGNSSAAGFSISLDHWATMGASMRASQASAQAHKRCSLVCVASGMFLGACCLYLIGTCRCKSKRSL